ncbi:ATP-NAD kinase [Pseudohyphozyma bogoriensis]|nr:ATP-NAD kinase [Pseudohyphozyma bogoriensis]
MLPRTGRAISTAPFGRRAFSSCAPRLASTSRRNVSMLPLKGEMQVAAMGRFANVIPPRKGKEVVQRVGSTYGHIQQTRPEMTVIVEQDLYDQLGDVPESVVALRPYDVTLLPSRVDFVVAVGGDGTLLRVSSMFDGGAVPPVLGVNLGTLGFMMPVSLEAFPKAFVDVVDSKSAMLLRMRLHPLSRLPAGEGKPGDEKDEWIRDIRRLLKFNAPFLEGGALDE